MENLYQTAQHNDKYISCGSVISLLMPPYEPELPGPFLTFSSHTNTKIEALTGDAKMDDTWMESQAGREEFRYLSYLLRLWQTSEAGSGVWHCSLEDPHTGVQQGFGDVERLFDFLRKQIDIKKSIEEEVCTEVKQGDI